MFYRVARRQLVTRQLHITNPQFAASTPRTFQSSCRALARKDAQDKDSLKPESNEYSKSGSDDASAEVEDAAFNPNKTRPEEEHDTAARESKGEKNSPLNVSPANQEISKPRHPREGGAEGSKAETGQGGQREGASGGGSPAKGGGNKSGGS